MASQLSQSAASPCELFYCLQSESKIELSLDDKHIRVEWTLSIFQEVGPPQSFDSVVRGDRYKHKIKAKGDRSKRSSDYLPNEY